MPLPGHKDFVVKARIIPSATIISCISWFLLFGTAALAAEPPAKPEKDRFLRLTRDAAQTPVTLETSIVSLAAGNGPKNSPRVDLIAAVHIGDKAYYAELNRLFRSYDAVLYELIASEKLKAPAPGAIRPTSALSMVQTAMTQMLSLQFQLDGIDYRPKNMVHADMSPEQFSQTMRRRGESFWTIVLRMMTYSMTRSDGAGVSDVDLLAALFDTNRSLALKRAMAEEFRDMEGSINAVEGPTGSTLISERNKVALGVLRKQIAAGSRRIAIFYGAGHMPDFEKRIGKELGLAPVATRWLMAWNMKDKAAKPDAAKPQAVGR
jgi:hypothetical protein